MRVFISWSGSRSEAVGKVFRDWIECVIQSIKPWYSPDDIDRGAHWFNEINSGLKDTAIGIICLTQENKDKPWILFEAGALTKGLSETRVCPILIDLESTDITGPLAQFNHTLPTEESMFKLVKTINKQLGDDSLESDVLKRVFETYWPQFKESFDKAISRTADCNIDVPERTNHDVLSELLMVSRSISRRVDEIELRERAEKRSYFIQDSIETKPFAKRASNGKLISPAIRVSNPSKVIYESNEDNEGDENDEN